MDQPKVPSPAAPISGLSPQGVPPTGLPVLESKKIVTHTMREDIARIGGVSGAPIGAEEKAVKPFSENIPPPPLPPIPLGKDAFQEPIEEMPIERDQPVSFPGAENAEQTPKQFKIFIPPPKKGFNAVTIILISVLVLLIAGGGFGYWWFFIKSANTPAEATEEPTLPAPAPEPKPIIPTPEPQPEPEPEPEPLPPPIIVPPAATTTPLIATSTPPIVATSTPPIAEPTLPQAIINVDETIVIELSGPASTTADITKQIKEKNSKIISYKAVVRYPIKLTLAKEKKYASAQETANLIGLKIPADFWKNANELELISYKNGSAFRYGLAARTSNEDALKQIAGKWQPTMLDNLSSLYIDKDYIKPAAITFSENNYLDFYKRYINMPMPDVSLDYAISDKYFIVATSKEMIYAALDKTQTPLAK